MSRFAAALVLLLCAFLWGMAFIAMPQPYDFELSTERFRAFGPDLANLWHEGGLHRVVGGREVRIEPAPGGVLVELLADRALLLLPTTEDEVRAALLRLRSAPLLRGYRGRPPGDLDAVVDAVLAVARFAVANADRLLELDINPLIVRPTGNGAVAADVLIRMGANA